MAVLLFNNIHRTDWEHNQHGFLSQFTLPKCNTLRKCKFRGGYSSGFTLIEILIAVIIVGILMAFAIPVYTKNIEKSKTGEAAANLNLIRMAEKDYFLDNQTYTTDFSSLNMDNPNAIASTSRYFTYTIPTGNATGFTATATRKDGPYAGVDYYTIDQTGSIDSSHGHFQL